MIYFTPAHQWLRFDGNIACTGISDHLAKAMGTILSFETHELGTQIAKGDVIATLETSRSVSKFRSLVAGEISELNTILDKSPELIGSSPEGEGWFVKLRIKALPDLDEFIYRKTYLSRIAAASGSDPLKDIGQ